MDRAEAEAIYDAGRDACVTVLLELTAGYERLIAGLEERLARLEAQARQDSRTSSKPPSSDPPKTRAQRRAEARAKAKELMRREGERARAGGQSGHRGAGRELEPEDQVDEIVDHYPGACGGCGRTFTAEEQQPRRRFGRRQVVELPSISVIVSEHRTHRLRCPACLARTTAMLPDGIAGSAFGPRLQAAVVTLTARHRVSRRGICELARDLFGARLSTGSVDAICQRASDALAGPHLQLQDWVLDQRSVHVDETGWRTNGDARALWTATTPEARVLPDRRALQPRAVRRARSAPRIRDRGLGPLERLQPSRPQPAPSVLVAPPTRFSPPRRWPGRTEDLRRAGRPAHQQVFAAWRSYQHEHHDRARLQAEIAPVQTELRAAARSSLAQEPAHPLAPPVR